VTTSRSQWQRLAARTLSAIRAVDPHHIVFVERTNGVGNDRSDDADLNFFLLPDANVVYEFHDYQPFTYTHQLASWVNLGEGGPYPDETRVESSGNYKWVQAVGTTASLPPGDAAWTSFEGPKTAVDGAAAKTLMPVLAVARLGATGVACFDDLTVWEHGPDGARALAKLDLGASKAEWYLWSADGTGEMFTTAQGGRGDGAALCARGTTGDANMGHWAGRFALRPGHSYSISGWARGEALGPTAMAALRLDAETTDGALSVRDRAYLASELDRFVRWGKANQVPLYLGEFGLNHPAFEMDRGGLRWVEDMLDLLAERELPFTYHAYHEDNFGIYYGYGTLPDPARANQPLIELFQRKLLPSR
jgi:endoglucanase